MTTDLRPHFLIVTPDPQDPQNPEWYRYSVECPGVTDECRMWQECPPGLDDIDALDALEDEGDDVPVVHGLRHRNMGGWMAETDRCYVQGHDALPEEVGGRFAPGRHPIGWDVGDGTELEILAIGGDTDANH